LTTAAGQGPHSLAGFDTSAANSVSRTGAPAVYGLAAAEILVGIGALLRRTRAWALVIGFLLIIAIWAVGQGFGLLFSGQATDPNSGPLIAMMAVALLSQVAPAPGRGGLQNDVNY
jgi:O-antigen/teichoic acid export membrane protein